MFAPGDGYYNMLHAYNVHVFDQSEHYTIKVICFAITLGFSILKKYIETDEFRNFIRYASTLTFNHTIIFYWQNIIKKKR